MTTTPTSIKNQRPLPAKEAAEHPDHLAIKSHFAVQVGRADIRMLWSDASGTTRYRVNFYVTGGSGIVATDKMVASFFVVVHEGLVIRSSNQ